MNKLKEEYLLTNEIEKDFSSSEFNYFESNNLYSPRTDLLKFTMERNYKHAIELTRKYLSLQLPAECSNTKIRSGYIRDNHMTGLDMILYIKSNCKQDENQIYYIKNKYTSLLLLDG